MVSLRVSFPSLSARACFKESDDVAFAEDEVLLDFEEGRDEDVRLLEVAAQLIVIVTQQLGDDEEECVFCVRPHQPGLGLFVSEIHRGVLADAIEDDECGVGPEHRDGLGEQLLESVELRLRGHTRFPKNQCHFRKSTAENSQNFFDGFCRFQASRPFTQNFNFFDVAKPKIHVWTIFKNLVWVLDWNASRSTVSSTVLRSSTERGRW